MKNLTVAILLLLCTTAYCAQNSYQSDQEILALTLAGEARGEGERGMLAVAQVVIQRYNSSRSTTISAVCLRPYQFSCWRAGVFTQDSSKIRLEPSWRLANQIAYNVLHRIPIRNTVGNATHYCRTDCSPSWASTATVTVVLGNHIFYKL